jgi:hypothetical protein
MDRSIWYQFAASQMQAIGDMLKFQDSNTTGNDDMAGNLLKSGSVALLAFARGDVKGFRGALKTIADSIYVFLESPA